MVQYEPRRIFGSVQGREGLRSARHQSSESVVWWPMLIAFGLTTILHFLTTDRAPSEWNRQLQSARVLAKHHSLDKNRITFI
jgi:hypothetical protein